MVSQGLAAIALGALLVARIEFATQAFGNEVGIGTLAVSFAVAAAVGYTGGAKPWPQTSRCSVSTSVRLASSGGTQRFMP